MNNKEFEWSLGNGQCPCCLGCGPSFDRQSPFGLAVCGHEADCQLAGLFQATGRSVLYRQRDDRAQNEEERILEDRFYADRREAASRVFKDRIPIGETI